MSRGPKTFADVIDQLGQDKTTAPDPSTTDTLATLEREFRRIWTAIDGGSTPPAADATDPAAADAEGARPPAPVWLNYGLVGALALIVGYLLGSRTRK